MAARDKYGLNLDSFRCAFAKAVAADQPPQQRRKRNRARLKEISVLVALSGGPDSVALLHLAYLLAEKEGFSVAAAHVNYRLRQAESDLDEQFCIDLCRRLNVTLYRKTATLQSEKPVNIQEAARRIRYRFFEQLRFRHALDYILIGHNRSDNVETILMNLFRGAGACGLSGMSLRSGRIIRPLLEHTSEEILGYLRRHSLGYRVDSSNLEAKYTRNRLRLSLLPRIEGIFGESACDNVIRAARILAEQQDFLWLPAQTAFRRIATTTSFGKIVIDIKRLNRYHDAVKRLVLALVYERLTGSLRGFEFAATSRAFDLLTSKQGRSDFVGGLFCEASGGRLYVYKKARRPEACKLVVPGENRLIPYGLALSAQLLPAAKRPSTPARKGGTKVCLDGKIARNPLQMRLPKPGDRFRPLGMSGSKKLSDFFVDRKVDRPLREEIPLVLSGEQIVWVVGHEIADPAKITETTTDVLKLEVSADRDR